MTRGRPSAVQSASPSFAQERLWFLHQREPLSAAYNLSTANRIRGPLDVDTLAMAVDRVVARHESLRTSFPDDGGRPRRSVSVDGPKLEILAAPAGIRTNDALASFAGDLGRAAFDVVHGPLARFVLVRLAPDDHLFVLLAHHLICDGWSIGLVYDELADYYGAGQQGISVVDDLPPLAFSTLADRERRRAEQGGFDDAISHWVHRLAGAPSDGLPLAQPRPAVQSFRGAHLRRRLDAAAAAGIERLAQEERSSLFMVVLAVWAHLLSLYGGGDDIVIGAPVAGRSDREARDVIGFFANTIAIRCDLSGDPTFRELLRRVRSQAIADTPYHGAPFDKVVEALRPARAADANVLFQHMLVLVNAPTTDLRLSGLEVEELPVETGASQFDLSLEVVRRADGLDLTLEFATALYDEQMAAQILDHVCVLGTTLVAAPDTPLSCVSLVPDERVQAEAARWNKTETRHRWEGSRLHELVERQAAMTPGVIAVSCGRDRTTYQELIDRSAVLAGILRSAGVGSDRCVGVLLPRSVGTAVALLGVSTAGGAFVPLDPAWPDARIAQILSETRAAAVITDDAGRVRRVAGALDPAVVELNSVGDARASVSGASVSGASQGTQAGPAAEGDGAPDRTLAHVFYTSGSTGKPKGVEVEHRSIVNRLAWAVDAYRITATDRVLVSSPTTFDPLVWELFCPLMVGAQAVITQGGTGESAPSLVRVIRHHRITLVEVVPSMLSAMVQEPTISSCRRLRAIVCGSETMPASLPRQVGEVLAAQLYNAYGPTEAAIDSTVWRCDPSASGSVPIGHPIWNTTVHILDPHGRPTPDGVPGEICIGGVGVARGYVERPEETAARFVPDPFTSRADGRLYRTGDIGRRRRDGALEFLGRLDRQVKINGVRVEPAEVEQSLRDQPSVKDAAVIAVSTTAGDGMARARLVAFLVGEAVPPAIELRDHLLARLPRSFVPTAFTVVDALPLDGNGKVDRRALTALAQARSGDDRPLVPPTTATEQHLWAIWSDVLGTVGFGVTDSFFDVGGDSILSMQVVARARGLGIGLTVTDLARAHTIEELALLASAPPEQAVGADAVTASLAPAQAWFFAHDFADPEHYNDAVLLRLSPSCDLDRLLLALGTVVGAHPELGLRFEEGGAGWRQHVSDRTPRLVVDRVDLSGVPEVDVDRLRHAAAQRAHRSLDPTSGRLGRALLITRGGERDLMVLFHHLVIDAVSWRVILGEVTAQYAKPTTPSRPAATGSRFLTWVEQVLRHTEAGGFDDDLQFWLSQRGPRLPRDHQPGPDHNRVADVDLVRSTLGPTATGRLLHQAPSRLGAPINAILLTAVARAVQRWAGTDATVIELEGHSRDLSAADRLDLVDSVGWFTSLFPVRLDPSAHGDPLEALAVVRDQVTAIPSRGASYGWLRYHHPDPGLRDRLSVVAPPELHFNYAGQFDHLYRADGPFRQQPYPPGRLQSGTAQRTQVIEINSFVLDGTFHHEWAYSSALHDRLTISDLAHATERELVALLDAGGLRHGASTAG